MMNEDEINLEASNKYFKQIQNVTDEEQKSLLFDQYMAEVRLASLNTVEDTLGGSNVMQRELMSNILLMHEGHHSEIKSKVEVINRMMGEYLI